MHAYETFEREKVIHVVYTVEANVSNTHIRILCESIKWILVMLLDDF